MRFPRLTLGALALLTLAGCGATPSSSGTASTPALITAAPTPKATGIAAIDPCTLVTPAQLRQIFRVTVSDGLPNLQAGAECDYGGSGTDGISIAIESHTYDATGFQTYLDQQKQAIGRARPNVAISPLSGLGDAAASLALAEKTGTAASVWTLDHGIVVTASCSFAKVPDAPSLVPQLVRLSRLALPQVLGEAGA